MSHSTKSYIATFKLLFVLLIATVAVAQFDFGPLNDLVAMSIAVAKALVIAVYFMHIREAGPLARVFMVAGVMFLALLMGLTLIDVFSRIIPATPV